MVMKSIIFFIVLVATTFALPAAKEQELNENVFFSTSSRIIGGDVAAEGSHPHMVALTQGYFWKYFICGGSLISLRTVLTAAHCIDPLYSLGSLTRNLQGTLGSNRWDIGHGGVDITFSHNVSHPHWERNIVKNDIAMLITTINVVPSARVNVIPLGFEFVGGAVPVTIAGFGKTVNSNTADASPVLLELNTQTISGEECIRLAPIAAASINSVAPPVDPALEICTLHSPGRGNCGGDSGSALVHDSTGQQIGLVSWGIPCAIGGPDVYTRISAHRNWILENIV